MAFIDLGEFEAMKTLTSRRAPRCEKHQFRAKITVSTSDGFGLKWGLLSVARDAIF